MVDAILHFFPGHHDFVPILPIKHHLLGPLLMVRSRLLAPLRWYELWAELSTAWVGYDSIVKWLVILSAGRVARSVAAWHSISSHATAGLWCDHGPASVGDAGAVAEPDGGLQGRPGAGGGQARHGGGWIQCQTTTESGEHFVQSSQNNLI